MSKENIIKQIEQNFKDMEKALINNYAFDYIALFRDYTDEIIDIIEKEMENK